MTLTLSVPAFERYQNEEITAELLEDAAKLFSANYGKWSIEATKKFGRFAKNGSRVHLSTLRLRNQCLPGGVPCTHVRVFLGGKLAGHVFAAQWVAETGKSVCWVTQLVVHANYRERGLATGLLRHLKENGDYDIYGIMSSHPAACKAAATAFGSKYPADNTRSLSNPCLDSIKNISLAFIKEHAESVVKSSPVTYIHNAKLHGVLFDAAETDDRVSSAYSGFFVDHEEPLLSLERIRKSGHWPLGELLEGNEFILLVSNEPES
jgi:hypothetical protein